MRNQPSCGEGVAVERRIAVPEEQLRSLSLDLAVADAHPLAPIGRPSVSARLSSGSSGPAELVMLGNSVEP